MEGLTPELRFTSGGRIKLPSFSFCVPREDDGVMANFLGDKMHPGVLECFRKQRITSKQVQESTALKRSSTYKPFRPVRCLVFAYVETANAATKHIR